MASGDYDDCLSTAKAARLVRFVKTHDAYVMTPAGEPLLGGTRSAYGAIVVVRDPRDVAPSLAHHLAVSIDDAILIMSHDGAASTFSAKTNRQERQFRQTPLSWSSHAASWFDQTDFPLYLIRYEDLLTDTAGTLSGVLDFAGFAAPADKIDRAVKSCVFAVLREEEQRNGFAETQRPGQEFFRRGEAGGWRNELSREQILRIETDHGRMMLRLGYELSSVSDLAHAG
jgi:aryl sulfotransferase